MLYANGENNKHKKVLSNDIFDDLRSFKIDQNAKYGELAPYMHCNEQQQDTLLKNIEGYFNNEHLAQEHNTEISAHIGFSLWFNLDLLSIANIDYAIILDIDPKVCFIYEIIVDAFKKSNTPEDFANYLLDGLANDPRGLLQFDVDFQRRMLANELNKGFGFLSSPECYQQVKVMSDSGRIFFGTANLTSLEDMSKLEQWCRNNHIQLKTLYLSNIPEWILENGTLEARNALTNNIKLLMHEQTVLIDAFYPTKAKTKSGPPQRLTIGKIPTYTKDISRPVQVNLRNPMLQRNISKKLSFNVEDKGQEIKNDRESLRNNDVIQLTFLSPPADKKRKQIYDREDLPTEDTSQGIPAVNAKSFKPLPM